MKRTKLFSALAAALSGFAMRFALQRGALLGAVAVEVDSLDAVPAKQRGWYVEDAATKKFKLDPSKIEIAEDQQEVNGLKAALNAEREAAAAARRELGALAKKFEGVDPDAMKALLARFDGEEEAQLIKAGKFDEVLNKRTAKMQEAHLRELKEKENAITKEQERTKKYEMRVLDSHLMAAATKAGVHQHAMEDVLFRGRSQFKLDEEGNPIKFLEDGKTVELGKDGKTPFGPDEWIVGTMKEKAPHWFPASGSGGGSGGDGSRGTGGGGKRQMRRADFDAITDPVQRAETAKTVQLVD